MTPEFRLILDKITSNPKRLLGIDGLGALLSAFFLGVVLVRFEDYFGMPRTVLYALSLVACLFAIYSICCYFLLTHHWRPYLKIITILNILYCCLTMGFVFYFYQKLTHWGLIYFLLEFIVLIVLITIERMALSKMREKPPSVIVEKSDLKHHFRSLFVLILS